MTTNQKLNIFLGCILLHLVYKQRKWQNNTFSQNVDPVAMAQAPRNAKQWNGLRHFFSRNIYLFELQFSGVIRVNIFHSLIAGFFLVQIFCSVTMANIAHIKNSI